MALEGDTGHVEPDGPAVLVEEAEHQQRSVHVHQMVCFVIYLMLLRSRESAVENIEARLRAEEMARVEGQARQVAETQNQEMEREVVDLQGKNQELISEVERLTDLLNQKPKV